MKGHLEFPAEPHGHRESQIVSDSKASAHPIEDPRARLTGYVRRYDVQGENCRYQSSINDEVGVYYISRDLTPPHPPVYQIQIFMGKGEGGGDIRRMPL